MSKKKDEPVPDEIPRMLREVQADQEKRDQSDGKK